MKEQAKIIFRRIYYRVVPIINDAGITYGLVKGATKLGGRPVANAVGAAQSAIRGGF